MHDCLKDSPLAWPKLELYHYLWSCFFLPSPLHRAQTCIAIQWFSSSPVTHSSLSMINLCTSNPRLASVSWSTQNNTKQQWLPWASESICNFFLQAILLLQSPYASGECLVCMGTQEPCRLWSHQSTEQVMTPTNDWIAFGIFLF